MENLTIKLAIAGGQVRYIESDYSNREREISTKITGRRK